MEKIEKKERCKDIVGNQNDRIRKESMKKRERKVWKKEREKDEKHVRTEN